MKKAKLLLVAITAASLGVAITACGDSHEHEYGDWVITTEPTLDEGGEASRNCVKGDDPQTFPLPALSDGSFWTKTEKDATCTEGGAITYTSEYGTVSFPIPADGHEFGEWKVTKEPTLDAAGEATRTCSKDNATDKSPVPALSDNSWKKEVISALSHTQDGVIKYTHETFGELTVTTPAQGHSWSEWEVTTDPTLDAKGEARRTCDCGEEDTLVLPALSDASFWTKESETLADYNHAGEAVYKNGEYDLTYTVKTADKLVAPYDNKTYYGVLFNFTDEEYKNREKSMESSWLDQHVVLDANGYTDQGVSIFGANNRPFQIQMVDAQRGAIKTISSDEEVGYVDMASGIFVVTRNGQWDFPTIGTPFETEKTRSDCATASCWTVGINVAIAITYTAPNGTVYRIFIYNNNVYFNVSFVDGEGNEVKAENCFNAARLYVQKDGGILYRFGYSDGAMHVLDGLEGNYAGTLEGASATLTLTGYGVATTGSKTGTYKTIEGGKLAVTFEDAYYVVTLGEGTFTAEKPTAHIVYDLQNDNAALQQIPEEDRNINIVYTLPMPNVTDTETEVFKGWYYDAACTQAVETPFVPTADVTLYAKWAKKKTITVHSKYNSEETESIVVAAGDNVKELLSRYDLDLDDTNRVYFDGWFIDAEYTRALPDSLTIPEEDREIHLYAKWTEYPVYAGTYKGKEFDRQWIRSEMTITISPRGVVSGTKTGTITRYDETTQYLYWQETSGAERSFRFDAETGVLVANYGSNMALSDDIYVTILNEESSVTDAASFGINYRVKDDGSFVSESNGQYTVFVSFSTGERVLIFNDRIYTSFKVTNTADQELVLGEILGQETAIIVFVGENLDEFLFGAGTSDGSKLGKNSILKQLDFFYGTYTVEGKEDKIVLDGVGGITFGAKTGTYTAAQTDAGYTFDVYLENGTEYYRLTVTKATMQATIEQPFVTVVYSSTQTTFDSVSQNVNIQFNLPTVEHTADYFFRGWYTTANFTGDPITTYTPDGSQDTVTFYAKWLKKVTVTLNLNYEVGNPHQVLDPVGEGETIVLANAKRDDAKFLGWFTSPTGGTQFISEETPITVDIELYAHWGEPSAFKGTYVGSELGGISNNSPGKGITIDADGVMSSGLGNSYTGGMIVDYDAAAQRGTWVLNGKTYYFWYDSATGVLILRYTPKEITDAESFKIGSDIYLLTLGTENAITNQLGISYKLDKDGNFSTGTSTWSDYETRFVTLNGSDILIFNNKIYTGYTVKNTAGDTLATINDIKASKTVVVYVNGEVLFAAATTETNFGTSGAKCQQLDEYFGKYTVTNPEGEIVLDGAGNLTFGEKTGTYEAAEEGAGYTFEVYFKVGNVSKGEYWRLTVNKTAKTATMVQPMVTITWSTAHGKTVTEQVNMNVEISDLPELTAEGFIFRYWSEEEGGVKCSRFTPKGDKTLYAVWDEAIALTLVYGNGYDTVNKYFAAGDTIDFTTLNPEEVYRNEMAFMGWYTDAACTNPVTFTTMPEATQTIYAKWVKQYFVVAEKTNGAGFKYDAVNEYYYTKSGRDATASMTITAGKSGTLTLEYLVSSEGGSYDYMTISLNNSEKKRVGGTSGEGCASSYDASKFVEFSIDVTAGDKITISYRKDSSGDNGADTVWIRNIELIVPDLDAEGDYTCAGQTDIHFDGIKTFTRGEETGTGVAIEGQESAYDVFFMEDGKPVSHYTIVLDKGAKTYTITESKVQITWNMNGHGTAPSADAFTGVALTLPTAETMTAAGFLFLGWYENADFSGNAVTTVTPVEGGTYTYYAKWAEAFTLTIVYGNEMENGVYTIASGDTVNLNSYKPKYTNGLSFEGWYTNAGFTTPVTATSFAMSANTTVYVKWVEGASFIVEEIGRPGPNATSDKVFTEYGTGGEYRTTAEDSGNTYLAIHIYADGKLSFNWKAIDGDPHGDGVDCQFQYAVYNEEGIKTKSETTLSGSMSTNNNASLDSLSWNEASIDVKAGTTIYLVFNRAWAGTNAQAAVANISLS